MAVREMAPCLAVCGLIETATAESAPAPETETPLGRMAQTITGRVTFSPSEITFQNGKSLPLTHGGQMLFRAETKKKKAMADLYWVISPDDPALENGNKVCNGKPIAYLTMWKPNKVGNKAVRVPWHLFLGRS